MNWLREPDAEPLPGYRLLEPIGTGGFGEVWKCVAPGGIFKAMKFVYGNLNALDGDDARALQEMKALERVKMVRHPFLLSIEQIQDVGGELVIVMELADKNLHETLVEYQEAGRPGIPRDVLLGFLDDAAVGLDHLIEKHNLQHLDVKPRNLFVVADRVKVADFGLVKQLERSSSSGLMGGVTPIYAAPETFQNKISKHSDQYSLAVVYVELLTGKRPFAGKNIRQLALQHMTEQPDLSMLPEADRPVVARALAKEPDERWPSCTAFVRSLAGPREGGGGSSGGSSGPGVREPAAWAKASRTVHDVDLTPAGTFSGNGVATLPPPPRAKTASQPQLEIDEDHLLGATAPQKELGVLRPTVLIGVGSFGRRALQEIRCRLTDRVGDVVSVPCFRFLYVDCDPDAVTKAVSAPQDVALATDEVFPVPLQPVTQYRRRQLEQILDWLPREKLYSIPRSLQAGGSRALGRLAFCDNYLRFVTRLRREFQVATHPESMSQSSDQTGLVVRDNVPQVYVFASATGGSGGMLIDLGYAVRRVLARMTAGDAPVTAFVYAGAPNDPNSPDADLANLYAAITELNHYADPDVSFVAHYGGPEGPKVEAKGLPFSSTYLMPLKERAPGAFRDCISHLAGYVSHEMTTQLGAALEQTRSQPVPFDRGPFRAFGTYGVWFPRGLLLRSAAQKLCLNLLREWKLESPPVDPAAMQDVVARAVTDPRLRPESVREQLETAAVRGGEGGPADQIERWLTGLENQLAAAGRHPDAGAWSRAVWEQARDLIGSKPVGEQDSTVVRRSRTSKALEDAVKRVSEMWGNEFAELVRPLEELPGRRLGAIGTSLKRLAAVCIEWANEADAHAQQVGVKARQVKNDLQAAHDLCQAGSGTFSFFGGRSGRSMRHFLDQIRSFARIRLQEDLADATAKFYRALRVRVEERLRDLAYCRTRMDQLVQALESPLANLPASSDTPVALSEESLQQTIRPTNTLNVVLPSGDRYLERAVSKVVKSVKPQDVQRLEVALQKLVLEPRGGLTALCAVNADMSRTLVAPMVEQATAFLSDLLPVTDVTEVEVSAAQARKVELPERIQDYYARSMPPCGSEAETRTFVLVPDTESGKSFASLVKRTVPAALTIAVNGAATDLMFCREHGNLRADEVAALLAACQPAYYQSLASQHTTPHARFDVTEWLPLVE
jgi:hypothetical protein